MENCVFGSSGSKVSCPMYRLAVPLFRRGVARVRRAPVGVVSGFLIAILLTTSAAARDVSWIGPSSGDWSVPENWTDSQLPLPADNVTIVGATVTVSDTRTVDGTFTLSGNAVLHVSGAPASFTASGAATLDNSRVSVTGGGTAVLDTVSSYAWGTCSSLILFNVDGNGSSLDLSGIQTLTLNAPSCSATPSIQVSNGGMLDLSALESITTESVNNLAIRVLTGGSIDFSSLLSTVDTIVSVDPTSSLSLPALTMLADSTVTVNAGGSLSAPSLTSASGVSFVIASSGSGAAFTALESISDSIISVNGGGSFSLPALTTLVNTPVTVPDGATRFPERACCRRHCWRTSRICAL